MRRLSPLLVCLVPCVALAQQPPDFSKVEIKVEKVRGSVYMLTGAGGNIGVSVGDDGIVIVDDQFAPLAPKIAAALKGISDRPVRFVINTHWHPDHVGANGYFQKQGPVLAHENVRKRMATGAEIAGMKVPAASPGELPIVTFNDRASLHLNGEEIRAIHLPAGHTDGDAVVFFTRSNVVHMGDDFVTYGFPFVDRASGGSAEGMLRAVRKVMATVPPDAKVIPGHGKLGTIADLGRFAAMLEDTLARVRKGVAAGKSAAQLQQEKVLAGYESWSSAFISTDKFIETLYAEVAGTGPGEFIRHDR